jgi:hypothetical protein
VVRKELILVGALLALAAAGAAAASAPTKLERWVAVRAGKIAPGIRVDQRGRGYCFAGSLADPRADAWRCVLGKQIEDPCFSGGATLVLCPSGTPDSHDALELRLTKPLPPAQTHRSGDPTRQDPWVIVTAGAYCYRTTAASAPQTGRALSYICAGASVLAGSPDRAHPVWTIALLPTATAKRYVTTAIKAAWW